VLALTDSRIYFIDVTPMSDVFDFSAPLDPSLPTSALTVDLDLVPANWRLDHNARTRGLPQRPIWELRAVAAHRREAKALLNLYMWEARYLVVESYTLFIFKSQKSAAAGEKAVAVVPLEGIQAYGVSNLTVSGSGETQTLSESTSSYQNLLLLKGYDAPTTIPSPLALTSHGNSTKAVLLSRSCPGSPVFAANFTKDDLLKPKPGVVVLSFESASARDDLQQLVAARQLRHLCQIWITGCRELQRRGALADQGIFRLSGSSEHVTRVASDLMIGSFEKLPYVRDSNAVADVIKRALRAAPEPPMTFSLYADWLALAPGPAPSSAGFGPGAGTVAGMRSLSSPLAGARPIHAASHAAASAVASGVASPVASPSSASAGAGAGASVNLSALRAGVAELMPLLPPQVSTPHSDAYPTHTFHTLLQTPCFSSPFLSEPRACAAPAAVPAPRLYL
jgi:hypothetical protein